MNARSLMGHVQRHRRKYMGLLALVGASLVLALATDPRLSSSLGARWEGLSVIMGRDLALSNPMTQRQRDCLARYGQRRYLSEEESRCRPCC